MFLQVNDDLLPTSRQEDVVENRGESELDGMKASEVQWLNAILQQVIFKTE